MKKRTIILGAVFILLVMAVAGYFITSRLSVNVQTITASASDYPDAYKSIKNVVESGSAPKYLGGNSLGDIGDYTLVDVTVNLMNPGLFPAEWLEISTNGVSGDIAVYSLTGAGSNVEARSAGQMNLKLITTASPNARRAFEISYYVFGRKVKLTAAG